MPPLAIIVVVSTPTMKRYLPTTSTLPERRVRLCPQPVEPILGMATSPSCVCASGRLPDDCDQGLASVDNKFSDDVDVAALFAEALMCITPRGLWDLNTGKPKGPRSSGMSSIGGKRLPIAPINACSTGVAWLASLDARARPKVTPIVPWRYGELHMRLGPTTTRRGDILTRKIVERMSPHQSATEPQLSFRRRSGH
jgi:hypothetical protein